MSRGVTMMVAAADLARPGATTEAAYWMPADKGGHRTGEDATAWRKRKQLERRVANVQKLIAKAGGVRGHETCHWCDGSGLVFDYGDRVFVTCRQRRQGKLPPARFPCQRRGQCRGRILMA
jgi:hypothetical protein